MSKRGYIYIIKNIYPREKKYIIKNIYPRENSNTTF